MLCTAKDFKEEGFWTTVYYNAYVTAYNTRLVPAGQLAKSYADLLDSKWKGKLLMEGTKADWFAGMLQILGPERGLKYMRELAKQQPSPREGHELLAQLVVAGEGVYDINIPASSVERMKERGAPIDWTALGSGAGDHGRRGDRHRRAASERREIVFGICVIARRTEAYADPRPPYRAQRPRQRTGGDAQRAEDRPGRIRRWRKNSTSTPNKCAGFSAANANQRAILNQQRRKPCVSCF